MATSPMSEFIQHLRGTIMVREGADLTDGQLLEDYVSRRDEAALAVLVRRHAPMVWGVCRRVLCNYHDAEDAFQATFHVLVRKAASIASRELLANWLYGVAHQTALKAKATAAKRGARERQVTEMPEPAAAEQDLWHDLQPLLDETLSRLPDKYRSVIVLCDLEGKTRKEAARQLSVPEGTVASRMATARRMLANRLARHGLAVSGGVVGALLTEKALAGAPTSVVSSTIEAVTLVAAGQAAATGVISVKVAALTEGVLESMLLNKLKTATVVMMLFVAALSGGAGLIYQTQAAEQPKAQGATEKIEQKDAQATRPTETLAQKVMLAYIHNDAKGDEEFLGKWLSVRGRVRGVERVVIGKGPHYLLTLYNAPSEDRFGTVFPVSDKMALAFVFPSSSRKQLAKLQGGQEVTIEGVCEGRTAEGHDAISFTDCKIVKPKE